MPNTFTKLYVQIVFAVKYRKAVLEREWRSHLFARMGTIINEKGCKTIIINGVEDHVHVFLIIKPSTSISKIAQMIKSSSSKWINDNKLTKERFEWQTGFGAFTYAQSQTERVFNYIENQEEHHRKRKFLKEYLQLMQKFEIEYDEKYTFKELE